MRDNYCCQQETSQTTTVVNERQLLLSTRDNYCCQRSFIDWCRFFTNPLAETFYYNFKKKIVQISQIQNAFKLISPNKRHKQHSSRLNIMKKVCQPVWRNCWSYPRSFRQTAWIRSPCVHHRRVLPIYLTAKSDRARLLIANFQEILAEVMYSL